MLVATQATPWRWLYRIDRFPMGGQQLMTAFDRNPEAVVRATGERGDSGSSGYSLAS